MCERIGPAVLEASDRRAGLTELVPAVAGPTDPHLVPAAPAVEQDEDVHAPRPAAGLDGRDALAHTGAGKAVATTDPPEASEYQSEASTLYEPSGLPGRTQDNQVHRNQVHGAHAVMGTRATGSMRVQTIADKRQQLPPCSPLATLNRVGFAL